MSKTRQRLIELADRLQKQRGYTAWSFADLAAEVGIRKASVHHHFPTKGALLDAVIAWNTDQALAFAQAIADRPAAAQLDAFFDSYRGLPSRGICTCGALTMDLPVIPEAVRPAALAYVDRLRGWLTAVLAQGQADGTVRLGTPPEAQATLTIAALQGAVQHARARTEPRELATVIDQLRTLLLEEP